MNAVPALVFTRRILIKTTDLDPHGRPIADVWVKGKTIDQELLDQGLAVRMSE